VLTGDSWLKMQLQSGNNSKSKEKACGRFEPTHHLALSTPRRHIPSALTFLFEGEVFCEVPTLVVASEKKEGVGVVDLQCPQEQHTLKTDRKSDRDIYNPEDT